MNGMVIQQSPYAGLRELALFAGGAAESSAGTSLDGEPFAQLNVMPTQHKFWRNDKTMEFSNLSRFGLTCAVLTEDRGADVLTWYQQDFPVRIFPLLGKEQESKESDLVSGEKSSESFVKLSLDMSGWKTRQCSLVEDSEWYSGTWPRWGLMVSGECWEQTTLAFPMTVNVSGFSLPTVGKNEFRGTSTKRFKGSPYFRGAKMCEGLRTSETDPTYLHPDFAELSMDWPHMWTVLAPLGMDKYQSWRQQHSAFFPGWVEQ